MKLPPVASTALRLHARAWRPGAAATLLTLAVPAYAASALDPSTWTWHEALLAGSIGLLVVGMIAALVTGGDRGLEEPPGPDLRWWKNGEMYEAVEGRS